ncbi:hypothetical protein SNE40_003728 [Patella caerulea]|uniref:Uncharacterized protein n=1 Tax=Patella caerulea TaxID=87958 RepID=A0AAN8KH89_PATCE
MESLVVFVLTLSIIAVSFTKAQTTDALTPDPQTQQTQMTVPQTTAAQTPETQTPVPLAVVQTPAPLAVVQTPAPLAVVSTTTISPIVQARRDRALLQLTWRLQMRKGALEFNALHLNRTAQFIKQRLTVYNAALENLPKIVSGLITLPYQRYFLRLPTVLRHASNLVAANNSGP